MEVRTPGEGINCQWRHHAKLKWSVSALVSGHRPLEFSMVTPVAIYPPTWRGVLAALNFSNWLIIIFFANRQQGDSLPFK